MANWGVATEIKQHWDLHRVIDGLAKKIEFMQVDLEGARQTAELCEYQLQAARAHKYAKHCQGLIGQGLRVTQQNIQAVRIMWQPVPPHNNNNKNNKGKGRAV